MWSIVGLTKRQRDDFREKGFFLVRKAFGADDLAEIRAAYDEVLANPLRLGEQGKHPFEYAPLLHVRSPILCRYATSSKLVSVAVEILGPDVRLYWDQAVSKPPGATSDVPWHQDNGYLAVEPEEYLTCTVGIDATDEENGCLWIQPGSHRSGAKPHQPTDFYFQVGYEGAEMGVAVPQGEGDLLFFSSLTMHRTGPNVSTRPRRSWVIQFCHASARERATGRPFDDRLLVARGGAPLAEPVRERPFDFAALLKSTARAMRGS